MPPAFASLLQQILDSYRPLAARWMLLDAPHADFERHALADTSRAHARDRGDRDPLPGADTPTFVPNCAPTDAQAGAP